ncbi:TRAP transporter permease [Desulfurispira natronophila]|uniref:TRAP transporter 4TM/12TM fusion protein n=1 Tax=Desulfurispira natronophila TaxID=682562 RepID=A0A7W8DH60_9BACT|nr:TRAP transporter permease [Desulfurispira natronophila]MBB5022079.1 TRAP transporter 4TM/12TM fusion protein [Desulfurispira natronophila]
MSEKNKKDPQQKDSTTGGAQPLNDPTVGFEKEERINLDVDAEVELSAQRNIEGWLGKTISVAAAAIAALHIYSLVFYPIDPWVFRMFHIMTLSVLGFLLLPGSVKSSRVKPSIVDWTFAGLSVAVGVYIIMNYQVLMFRFGVMPVGADFYIALIGTLLVLEIARRASGWALPILSAVFIAYSFLGPYMPGVLGHRGYSPERFFTYIYGMDGVFSVPIAISSKYIIIFIIFSAFLTVSGVGRYFVEWAFSVSGHLRGGPAKVAILASALMGTMNGTSAGNAVATGSLTIPLMRKVGYKPKFAAATEAVASTGGQIMPPIMGAGVFIMAEMTGIPYQTIMIAGILPAILYFASAYFMVDKEASKLNLHGVPRRLLPPLGDVMKRAYMFLPIIILFGMLMGGMSVIRSGFFAIIAALVISWLNRETRMGFKATFKALEQGAKGTIQLMAVCAAAGIIMGVIALTGIGLKFSSLLLGIAGTSEFLAMFFAMIISIVLGMGMPTTAAYAVAASVVAPGLISMGIEPLLAHFFVFYFACVSAITPPVALAAYAASAISGSDPMKTGYTSFRLGIAAYIVPFMFFYAPDLLMNPDMMALAGSNVFDVALRFGTALLGIFALSSAVQSWYFGHVVRWQQFILFPAALLLVSPNHLLDLTGLGLLVLVYILGRKRLKPIAPTSPDQQSTAQRTAQEES